MDSGGCADVGTALILLFPGNFLGGWLVEKLFWQGPLSLVGIGLLSAVAAVAINAILGFVFAKHNESYAAGSHVADHSVSGRCPQDMCSGLNTIWSVADVDPAAKWTVVPGSITETVGALDSNGVPSCMLAFILQTTANVPGSFTAKPVITGKYGGSTFALSLQPIAFTASLFPQFGSKVLLGCPYGVSAASAGTVARAAPRSHSR